MKCCVPTIIAFSSVLSTSIAYTDAMKLKYGLVPFLEIYYYDPEQEDFFENNGIPVTQAHFTGSNINIDHGGLATGQIIIR